jgi:hypothetical protein
MRKFPGVPKDPAPAERIANDRTIPVTPAASGQWIQSLRTIPVPSFWLWSEPAISFAADGLYEIQAAVRKAILAAERYVYIEDQAMKSREVFGYLREALVQNPELVVILVTGQADPADPPDASMKFLLYEFLLSGLSEEEENRIVLYQHKLATIHSKVFLVDDAVAIVGSAGMFNRSLFTEWEHSVAFVDKEGSDSVKTLRKNLWGEIFRRPAGAPREQLDDLDLALAMWKRDAAWGSGAPIGRLPRDVQNLDELWQGSFEYGAWLSTFFGPSGPRVLGGPEGELSSLSSEFLVPLWDAPVEEYFVVDDEEPYSLLLRDHEQRRGEMRLTGSVLHVAVDVGAPTPITEYGEEDEDGTTWAFIEDDLLPPPDAQRTIAYWRTLDEEGNPLLDDDGSPTRVADRKALPSFAITNLTGAYVVCTGGANDRQLRRVVEHDGQRLYFEPWEHAVDASFTWSLALPTVASLDLPGPDGFLDGLSWSWDSFWSGLETALITDLGGLPFFSGSRAFGEVHIEADVGEGGANRVDDVIAIKTRLTMLGFDWLRINGQPDPDLIQAIRLFQAMKNGHARLNMERAALAADANRFDGRGLREHDHPVGCASRGLRLQLDGGDHRTCRRDLPRLVHVGFPRGRADPRHVRRPGARR